MEFSSNRPKLFSIFLAQIYAVQAAVRLARAADE